MIKKIIVASFVCFIAFNVCPAIGENVDVDQLTWTGLTCAFDGDFQQALDNFRKASRANPADPNIVESVSVLENYVNLRSKMDSDCNREFLQIVERVNRAILAQKYNDMLVSTGLDKKLRSHFNKVMESYKHTSPVNDLLEMDKAKAENFRERLIESVSQATELVKNFKEILGDDKSDYTLTFNVLVDNFVQASRKYLEAWRNVGLDSDNQRQRAVGELWSREYDLAIMLGDIEFMTVKKPWRIAMSQVILAGSFVNDAEEFKGSDWFDKTVELVRQKGDHAFANEHWYDAMWAYSTLSEQFTGDRELRGKAETIKRYVRVMNLYGNGNTEDLDEDEAKDSKGGENDTEIQEDEASWREIVSGADGDLVGKVIDYLSPKNYVSRVDYRTVALSGINAIRILTSVEDVYDTFANLKDAALRKNFLDKLNRLSSDIEKRDSVSQMDLQMVFNAVMSCSDKTVKIPTEVISVEFTDGMLGELDQFTAMIWPYDSEEFQKQIRGKFVGAGIRISKEPNEPLKVVRPIEDTPAFNAGIKRGDLIIAVDGKKTNKYSIDRLVRMIMGKEGTSVLLTIKREGVLNPFDVKIVRQPIVIKTVKGWKRSSEGDWDFMLDDEMRIGYIRLTQFGEQTTRDLVDVLDELNERGAESIILDLRFNPGGRLDCAVDVADQFLASGKIVATGQNVINAARHYLDAGKNGEFQDGDLIVLVNNQSASAAEIVSGALQDHKRAIIIGERSYGKGSVQSVLPLRWNPAARMAVASFKMTTAYYYLPSSRLLHRKPGAKDWGVDPDISVRIAPKQMRKWLELRYDTDVRSDMSTTQVNSELKDQVDADLQLNTALTVLKLMKINRQQVLAMKSKKAA